MCYRIPKKRVTSLGTPRKRGTAPGHYKICEICRRTLSSLFYHFPAESGEYFFKMPRLPRVPNSVATHHSADGIMELAAGESAMCSRRRDPSPESSSSSGSLRWQSSWMCAGWRSSASCSSRSSLQRRPTPLRLPRLLLHRLHHRPRAQHQHADSHGDGDRRLWRRDEQATGSGGDDDDDDGARDLPATHGGEGDDDAPAGAGDPPGQTAPSRHHHQLPAVPPQPSAGPIAEVAVIVEAVRIAALRRLLGCSGATPPPAPVQANCDVEMGLPGGESSASQPAMKPQPGS
ncbi:Os02g0586700 [Oryza sativa Japonica Group]|uniref:Os02g0586700 protein n=1 Tax=Oryza sativa subsp. japonica TaxID=39947 RepID=A0A0P0VL07_ORYSJ|nr:hypothetical protein EE612_012083 [Oryza sativa]BAS79470.1 Os02g0586700 [Oryza sativa Japonica Group]